jgi:hypothetical protein
MSLITCSLAVTPNAHCNFSPNRVVMCRRSLRKNFKRTCWIIISCRTLILLFQKIGIGHNYDLIASNFWDCQFLASWACDFDFVWLLTTKNWVVVHENDFNIGEVMNTVGMARKPLGRNITIQMRAKRWYGRMGCWSTRRIQATIVKQNWHRKEKRIANCTKSETKDTSKSRTQMKLRRKTQMENRSKVEGEESSVRNNSSKRRQRWRRTKINHSHRRAFRNVHRLTNSRITQIRKELSVRIGTQCHYECSANTNCTESERSSCWTTFDGIQWTSTTSVDSESSNFSDVTSCHCIHRQMRLLSTVL